ncbi:MULTISPECIES: aspartyl/asparaginyl beta-hydroxylase domain-containing protein [Streptomyces]|uniref:Aspartyl/asparaginyl beta-hydroxylase domain-containing protein n=3 Tax=Streptomyces sudanensis TaxID=436397 RepID=A0ABY4T971_9ACTN|nr:MULTISPECIES: aspartyl/asparaginyl beta-hydroxylase domain-containing protein [Streptomyces]MCP9985361.1 aspartyl/asparaginyl beta-hydroxylase domain-containing protein [Streptomyces sudanensis]MCQ0003203.1 aspartyl/asparaginyl beta-hydroxylase domain-containing protein [Streptomyces sudanensis]URN14594.1 aspartyl/asparaginyl beta-hydroxylase domain-containing protein [Streptomyces sudanensis]
MRDLPAAVMLRDDLDVDRLTADVAELSGSEFWALQRSFEDGAVGEETDVDWKVLPLRAPGGDVRRTDPGGPGLDRFEDTPLMAKAPYLARVLAELGAELRSVRLMALAPGVSVAEHADTPIGLPYGYVRLHIPLVTNPGAVLVTDGAEQRWQPGTLWYADFNRPHSVRNTGDRTRIHLVADCTVDDRLLALFPEGFRARLPVSDIAYHRPVLPLTPPELAEFGCRFAVPFSFMEWGEQVVDDRETDLDAEVAAEDGELVLRAEGRAPVGLLHLGAGEFRLLGWSEERLLRLDLFGDDPRVEFSTRCGRRRQVVVRPARRPAAA